MAADKGVVMGLRGSLVEHPFGTLKVWAGVHHFLMRGLAKCRSEFNLMALCYNFKRVLRNLLRIVGPGRRLKGLVCDFFRGRECFWCFAANIGLQSGAFGEQWTVFDGGMT